MLRFNARGPDGLVDGKSPGAPSKLNADHRRALAEVVEAGPVPAVDGVVRWRRKDLARWLLETFAISLDETTVGRELKALGFAKISARPRHYAQNELAVEAGRSPTRRIHCAESELVPAPDQAERPRDRMTVGRVATDDQIGSRSRQAGEATSSTPPASAPPSDFCRNRENFPAEDPGEAPERRRDRAVVAR